MKKSNILLTLGIVTTLGAGGAVGYGMYRDRLTRKAHETNVAAQVERFKACPGNFMARRSCHTEAERAKLQTEAENARERGRWEEAALKFVEIGRDNDAYEMIGRCDEATRRRLSELVSIRREALEAIRREMENGLVLEGRPASWSSSSAQPATGRAAPVSSSGDAGAIVSTSGTGDAAQALDAGAASQSDAAAVPAGDAGTASVSAPAATSGAAQTYSTQTNPFQLDPRLQGIAAGLSGNSMAKVQAIFDRLHRGGTEAVTVMDMSGRPPRTASEALSQGGDCTDLANIVIALFRQAGIPGGALVLHFDNAPANVDHMVAYAEIDGRRIIVDLQTSTLGQTAQGRYTELLRLTYDQAAFMYHREQGEYYANRGQRDQAIASYRRAIEIFDGDGYVHQNLGILLEQAGDMQGASGRFRRAAELDPRYTGDRTRGTYNQELQAGESAFRARRWREAEGHFLNALTSGETITDQERRTIERNIAACRRSAQR
jgi:tetratricopeptide (TPR) repeat protein